MEKKKAAPQRKKNPSRSSARNDPGNHSISISIGNISDVSGELNIAGGDITISRSEIQQLFAPAYQAIQTKKDIPSDQKDSLAAEVKKVQAAVTDHSQNNKKLDEGFLSRHFRNIIRMAPDILDVVVKSMSNPALGLGEVARRIAKKALEETR